MREALHLYPTTKVDPADAFFPEFLSRGIVSLLGLQLLGTEGCDLFHLLREESTPRMRSEPFAYTPEKGTTLPTLRGYAEKLMMVLRTLGQLTDSPVPSSASSFFHLPSAGILFAQPAFSLRSILGNGLPPILHFVYQINSSSWTILFRASLRTAATAVSKLLRPPGLQPA